MFVTPAGAQVLDFRLFPLQRCSELVIGSG